jgi:hypothetical protein
VVWRIACIGSRARTFRMPGRGKACHRRMEDDTVWKAVSRAQTPSPWVAPLAFCAGRTFWIWRGRSACEYIKSVNLCRPSMRLLRDAAQPCAALPKPLSVRAQPGLGEWSNCRPGACPEAPYILSGARRSAADCWPWFDQPGRQATSAGARAPVGSTVFRVHLVQAITPSSGLSRLGKFVRPDR